MVEEDTSDRHTNCGCCCSADGHTVEDCEISLITSIPLSWRRPSTGPYQLVIKPIGVTTDWNLIALTFLWPLYNMRWSFLGLQIGRSVPSMNPQQFYNGDTPAWILSAKSWRLTSASHRWFIHKVHDMITIKTKFWRRSSESTDHVQISAWIGKSFKEYRKRLDSIDTGSIVGNKYLWNF